MKSNNGGACQINAKILDYKDYKLIAATHNLRNGDCSLLNRICFRKIFCEWKFVGNQFWLSHGLLCPTVI